MLQKLSEINLSVILCSVVVDVADGGGDEDTTSLPILDQLPEQVLLNLRQIASWLLSCGYETDFMQAYATVRSQVLIRSLQKFVSMLYLVLFRVMRH